jgi:hypothetical protein
MAWEFPLWPKGATCGITIGEASQGRRPQIFDLRIGNLAGTLGLLMTTIQLAIYFSKEKFAIG